MKKMIGITAMFFVLSSSQTVLSCDPPNTCEDNVSVLDSHGEIVIDLKEGGETPDADYSRVKAKSYYDISDINSGEGEINGEGYANLHRFTETKENGDIVNVSWGDNGTALRYSLTNGGTGLIQFSNALKNKSESIQSGTINGVEFTGKAEAGDFVAVKFKKQVTATEQFQAAVGAELNGIAVTWKSADGKSNGGEVRSKYTFYCDCPFLEQAQNKGAVTADSKASEGNDYAWSKGSANYELPANNEGYAYTNTFANMETWEGGKFVETGVKTRVESTPVNP